MCIKMFIIFLKYVILSSTISISYCQINYKLPVLLDSTLPPSIVSQSKYKAADIYSTVPYALQSHQLNLQIPQQQKEGIKDVSNLPFIGGLNDNYYSKQIFKLPQNKQNFTNEWKGIEVQNGKYVSVPTGVENQYKQANNLFIPPLKLTKNKQVDDLISFTYSPKYSPITSTEINNSDNTKESDDILKKQAQLFLIAANNKNAKIYSKPTNLQSPIVSLEDTNIYLKNEQPIQLNSEVKKDAEATQPKEFLIPVNIPLKNEKYLDKNYDLYSTLPKELLIYNKNNPVVNKPSKFSTLFETETDLPKKSDTVLSYKPNYSNDYLKYYPNLSNVAVENVKNISSPQKDQTYPNQPRNNYEKIPEQIYIPKKYKLYQTDKLKDLKNNENLNVNNKPIKKPKKIRPKKVESKVNIDFRPKELKQEESFISEQKTANHLQPQNGQNDRLEFQFHGHDGPHSYKFGYDTGKGHDRQFRYEERDKDGHVKGHYGFYEEGGKLRIVNYDSHPIYGFHVHPE